MSVKTIRSMLDWVESHLEEEPTLSDLSDFVGYSPVYCSAKLREYTGIAFREYLARRRLTHAAEKLQETKWSILEIAMQYGFSSHEAFTRAFRRVYGCSPSRYRSLSKAGSGKLGFAVTDIAVMGCSAADHGLPDINAG